MCRDAALIKDFRLATVEYNAVQRFEDDTLDGIASPENLGKEGGAERQSVEYSSQIPVIL